MDIKVSSLINISNLTDYKIHFAVWSGENQPLDVFVRDWDEWEGWNSWRGNREDFPRRYIFSLIRFYPLGDDKWLFGGIFEVLSRNENANVVGLMDIGQEYVGRLLIHHPGPGTRGRAFYLEKHYENLIVSQILDRPYSGEHFCGYDNINHDFAILEIIIKSKRHDWKAALQNIKGVYLIVDKCNGKMYVGSAYGDSGIWSRWACYIGTGHGWNDEMVKLINEKGIEYARQNFKFSLLEFRSMNTDDNIIIEREQYWKRILLTGNFGYNKN
jgi:hypothetical protein